MARKYFVSLSTLSCKFKFTHGYCNNDSIIVILTVEFMQTAMWSKQANLKFISLWLVGWQTSHAVLFAVQTHKYQITHCVRECWIDRLEFHVTNAHIQICIINYSIQRAAALQSAPLRAGIKSLWARIKIHVGANLNIYYLFHVCICAR